MKDEELLIHAVREAQQILEQHFKLAPCDSEKTIGQLAGLLEREDLIAAIDRLDLSRMALSLKAPAP